MKNRKIKKFEYLIYFLLIITGFWLRWIGHDFGLPHRFHPDEFRHVVNVEEFIAQKTFIPKSYVYPPLLPEIVTMLSFVGMDLTESGSIISCGRRVSVLLGSLTGPFAGLTASYLCHPLAGIIAAGLITFSPLHIEQSRYFMSDTPLVFFLTIVIFLTTLSQVKNKKRYLIYAALISGFGAMTKQNGLIFIIVPLTAVLLNNKSSWMDRLKFSLLILCVFVFAICISAPGFASNLNDLVFMYRLQAEYYGSAHIEGYASPSIISDSIKLIGWIGIGWLGFVLSFFGLFKILKDKKILRLISPLLIITGLSLITSFSVTLLFARNLIWTFPGLSILAAIGFYHVFLTIKQLNVSLILKRVVISGLFIGVLAPIVVLSVNFAMLLQHLDTRIRAEQWLQKVDPDAAQTALCPPVFDCYLPPGYTTTNQVPAFNKLKPVQYKNYGIRYVITSYGKLSRFMKASHRYPRKVLQWVSWIEEMKSFSQNMVIFEEDHGICGELFGTTAEIYHHPTIIIFDLGPTSKL